MNIDVSIIVVSFNTSQMTLECLRSVIERTKAVSYELIVVDNASNDGSANAIANAFPPEAFPQVRLIRFDKNIGFARANNRAGLEAKGRYVLLLNPDTVTLDGAIDKIVRFGDAHQDVGIVGGRTFFGDGSLNRNSCHGVPTPWSVICQGLGLSSLFRESNLFNPEGLGRWERSSAKDVAAVTGCLLLIRTQLWQDLGGFDESFFMYGEDTDLCIRATRAGWICRICPDAQIIHYGGQSDRIRADKMVKLFRAKSQLINKHWPRRRAALGVNCLAMWALTRRAAFWAMSWVKPKCKASFDAWDEIWRRRGEFVNLGSVANG